MKALLADAKKREINIFRWVWIPFHGRDHAWGRYCAAELFSLGAKKKMKHKTWKAFRMYPNCHQRSRDAFHNCVQEVLWMKRNSGSVVELPKSSLFSWSMTSYMKHVSEHQTLMEKSKNTPPKGNDRHKCSIWDETSMFLGVLKFAISYSGVNVDAKVTQFMGSCAGTPHVFDRVFLKVLRKSWCTETIPLKKGTSRFEGPCDVCFCGIKVYDPFPGSRMWPKALVPRSFSLQNRSSKKIPFKKLMIMNDNGNLRCSERKDLPSYIKYSQFCEVWGAWMLLTNMMIPIEYEFVKSRKIIDKNEQMIWYNCSNNLNETCCESL